MALTLTSLPDLASHGFDAIIDVRSPAEYAEDHLPGAINLPVLDNEERARVGTIYKQQSSFLARKLGAALVARNAARHLEGPLSAMEGGWRPLVYCWRGGQRSGSFATILAQVGWRVELVQGGYKAWRKLVVEALETPPAAPVVILDGNTGSAKTELLALLSERGAQTVDLEGLANHRGSLFGHMPGGQPSQKAFEGRVATALAALDPARPVVVEAESSRDRQSRGAEGPLGRDDERPAHPYPRQPSRPRRLSCPRLCRSVHRFGAARQRDRTPAPGPFRRDHRGLAGDGFGWSDRSPRR